jgi:polysaccharide biosynthesis/export protein
MIKLDFFVGRDVQAMEPRRTQLQVSEWAPLQARVGRNTCVSGWGLPVCCLLLLLLAVPLQATFAQSTTGGQARELLGQPASVDLPQGSPDSGASRLPRTIQRSVSPTAPVQIIDRPERSMPGTSLRLSTQVETRVESQSAGGGDGRASAPAVAPAPPRINAQFEFENLVEQSVGVALPVFGDAVFAAQGAGFMTGEQQPLPKDYQLALGDEVATRAWGQIDVDHVGVIDRIGELYIPRIGTIPLAGLTIAAATDRISAALAKQYRNFQLSVQVGTAQPARVHVTGQAKRPGSITLPAYATFLTAVMQSGGPTARANYRTVQLRRGGALVSEIDLYDFLAFGNAARDVPIRQGDVIHFPVRKGLAAVAGSVNVPAIFQLIPGTTLDQLLRLAGEVTTAGKTRTAVVERIVAHASRTIELVTLDSAGRAREVQDGELYTILPVSPRIENVVTLSGNVALPLRAPHRAGMRVSDLIASSDALLQPAYWVARNQQNTLNSLGEKRSAEIKRDLPEINWEYAVVERIDRRTFTPQLLPFNLGLAVNQKDPAHDLLLEPGDVISVFAKADLKLPAAQRTRYVRVEGEVKQAGHFSLAYGTSLRQAIEKAGGVTPDAYVFGLEITRESTRQFQQARMTETIDRLEQEFQRYFASRARNLTTQEEALAAPSEADSLKSLISRLRRVKATGRIILEIPAGTRADTSALPDLAVEDNDSIYVPPVPVTVSVVGAVVQEGTFLYRPEKTLEDYIRQAGGRAKFADESRIFVLRADGSVLSGSEGWLGKRALSDQQLMPGDTVVAPELPERVTWLRALKDWTQVFYQFGLGAAGIKILKGF